TLLWLAFSGGEIFLRSDIVEIAQAFYRGNRPAIMLFSTNGLLTDVIREKIKTILSRCRESTIVVKLSLEGPREVHDAIRGEGSFQRTMATCEELGGLLDQYPNIELGINTVFCAQNQDVMEETISFVKGLDRIKTHTISLVRGKGRRNIDMDKYRAASERLAGNLRTRESAIYRFRGARIKAAQDIVQRSLIYETEKHQRQLVPCCAGRLNLVLTETGDLYPCESFTMKMGNVRDSEYRLEKILRSPGARAMLKSIRRDGCYCSHECYLMTNILFNAGMYPRLAREYLRLGRG
ncbi:MAG: SPASM domain-containing protein, partial [Nitrospiraceae bacterium]